MAEMVKTGVELCIGVTNGTMEASIEEQGDSG
jgi:hypothetical protein